MFAQLATALWTPAVRRPAASRRAAAVARPREDDTTSDIRDFIKGLRIATVTTTDKLGVMHSCPVTTLMRDFDGEIWLPAHRSTPVVNHLREAPNVLVTYINGLNDRCLTLHGVAQFDVDRDAARSHWHRGLAPWFTQGPDDPELVLIRVKVLSADLWE